MKSNRITRYLMAIFLLTSCSMSEVLETPMPRTKVDTTYIPRTIQKDTNDVESSGIPIEFDVAVESWE